MSERIISPERPNIEKAIEGIRIERPKSAEYTKADQEQQVEKAQAAVSSEVGHSERSSLPPIVDDRPQLIDSTAKLLRMRHNLRSVQNKLKPAEKSFSKLVHQPLVQKVSESSAHTLARPSGLLGGGLTAFIGCLGYQILARYYGVPYNFSFFLLFFVAGFVFGLLGELVLRKVRH